MFYRYFTHTNQKKDTHRPDPTPQLTLTPRNPRRRGRGGEKTARERDAAATRFAVCKSVRTRPNLGTRAARAWFDQSEGAKSLFSPRDLPTTGRRYRVGRARRERESTRKRAPGQHHTNQYGGYEPEAVTMKALDSPLFRQGVNGRK